MKKSLRKLAIMTLAVVMAVSVFGTTTAQAKKKKTKTKKTKTKVEYQKPSIKMPDRLYLTKGTRVQLKAKNFTWFSCKIEDAEDQDCEGYLSISNKGVLTVNKTPEKEKCFTLDIDGGNKKYKLQGAWTIIHLYPEGYIVTDPSPSLCDEGFTSIEEKGYKFPYTVRFAEYNSQYHGVFFDVKNDNNVPMAIDINWQAKNKDGAVVAQGKKGYGEQYSAFIGPDFPVYALPGETVTVPILIGKDNTEYKNWDYSMNVQKCKVAFVYWKPKSFSCSNISTTARGKDKIITFSGFNSLETNPSEDYTRARVDLMKDGAAVGSFGMFAIENDKVRLRDDWGMTYGLAPDFDNVVVKPAITPVETYKAYLDTRDAWR